MSAPSPHDLQVLEAIERDRALGAWTEATTALIPLLEARAAEGDPVVAAAARALREGPFAPDALAAAVDRLLALVRAQEAQIEALRSMLETGA